MLKEITHQVWPVWSVCVLLLAGIKITGTQITVLEINWLRCYVIPRLMGSFRFTSFKKSVISLKSKPH